MSARLLVIGGGNMGAALLGGLLDAGLHEPPEIAVAEVLEVRRAVLAERFPGIHVVGWPADLTASAAVIAVKPTDASSATELAVAAGATRILSIAAGVRLSTLEDAAGPDVAVIRAMPNTPALVGEGASAIAGGGGCSEEDLAWAESVLSSVGTVDRLPEELLDAFTGVVGSGPAYVFLVAESLRDAAIEQGLEAAVAQRVVTQLLVGSAALLRREGDPAALREAVTSPNGTTAAGLEVLADEDLRGAFAGAVEAATRRSRELG